MPETAESSSARSLSEALRLTLRLVWTESDGFARSRLLLSLFLLAILSLVGASLPVLFKLIIDTFSGSADYAISAMTLVVAYILSQLVFHGVSDIRLFVHGVAGQRLNRAISSRLFEHIARLPLRFHAERRTGAVGEMIAQGLTGCQTLLQHLAFTFLPVFVELLAIVLVLVHFGHPKYLVILGCAAAAYGFIFWYGAVSVVGPSREITNAHLDAQALMTDSLLNSEAIKHFSAESRIASQYDRAVGRRELAWRRLLKVRTANGLIATAVLVASLGGALMLAGREVLAGTMTIGDFVLIAGYVSRLLDPLEAIGVAVREVSQSSVYVQRMLDLMNERTEASLPASSAKALVVTGEVVFDRVSLEYAPGRPVLKAVSFRIAPGSTLGVVGTSGAGKSSLVRLLLRLYEPTEGQVLLDGLSTSRIPLSQLRNAIALVPQDTILLDDTIANNIAFGRSDASRGEIEAAARLAHLDQYISSLPKGLETRVGERGVKLSGGERQRVSIARAALKKARIFVFDEATSSLDSAMEADILRSLAEVALGCTTIVIAHRLSTVVDADEIIVLTRGEIVERGNHADLMQKGGTYAALWRAQERKKRRARPLTGAGPESLDLIA